MITPDQARRILFSEELDTEIERRIDGGIRHARLNDSWPARLCLQGAGGLLSLDEALPPRVLPPRVLAAGIEAAFERVLARFRSVGWEMRVVASSEAGPGFLQLERP